MTNKQPSDERVNLMIQMHNKVLRILHQNLSLHEAAMVSSRIAGDLQQQYLNNEKMKTEAVANNDVAEDGGAS